MTTLILTDEQIIGILEENRPEYDGLDKAIAVSRAIEQAVLQSQDQETCSWSYDESDGAHQTSCGNMHIIIDGTPDDNGMKYCCYCGGRITPAIDHARRIGGEEK